MVTYLAYRLGEGGQDCCWDLFFFPSSFFHLIVRSDRTACMTNSAHWLVPLCPLKHYTNTYLRERSGTSLISDLQVPASPLALIPNLVMLPQTQLSHSGANMYKLHKWPSCSTSYHSDRGHWLLNAEIEAGAIDLQQWVVLFFCLTLIRDAGAPRTSSSLTRPIVEGEGIRWWNGYQGSCSIS